MTRQDQRAEGGEAYQARGNITVTNGMNADQMAAVMIAMGKQLQVHFIEAQTKLNERLTEFRNALLEEFAKPENEAATEAFKDPDFQFVLTDAQRVFARDGSSSLRDDLVKLLVQRSQLDGKDRIAKILNYSIELAGSFSKHEYAALAINFLFLNVSFPIPNKNFWLSQINEYIRPFYKDLSKTATVYEYIESQRCGTINYVVTRDLVDPLYIAYGNLFSHGFDLHSLLNIQPGQDPMMYKGLIVEISQNAGLYRFLQSDTTKLREELKKRGMANNFISDAIKLHRTSSASITEFKQTLLDEIEGFDRVLHIWNTTSLSKMALTAVGKAIAHASLTSRSSFSAPLAIWVQ